MVYLLFIFPVNWELPPPSITKEYCILLLQEKIKIQTTVSTTCKLLLHHHKVEKNCKSILTGRLSFIHILKLLGIQLLGLIEIHTFNIYVIYIICNIYVIYNIHIYQSRPPGSHCTIKRNHKLPACRKCTPNTAI